MSVKLSELLDKVADDVFERSFDCPIDESTAIRTRSRTLRAIAPELVEIAKTAKKPNELHGSVEDTHIPEHCPACRLVLALAKAGVTCE